MTSQTSPITDLFVSYLRDEIAACVVSARREGYDGTDTAYELTAADCEEIARGLGRYPTREEWALAGVPHIGSAHVYDRGPHLRLGVIE